ncbi:MAG: hypothetical protein ACOC33_00845 [bacterium]
MKNVFFIIIILVLPLSGCITTNQLEAEKSYYQLQAMKIKEQQNQPLFELESHDSSKPIIMENVAAIRVFQPSNNSQSHTNFQQYRHRDYISPWTNLLGKAISIGVPAFAAYKTIDSLAKNAGSSTNYSSGGDMDVRGNTSTIASGENSLVDQSVLNDDSTDYNDSYNNGMWDSERFDLNDTFNDNNLDSYNDANLDSYNDGMWDSVLENHDQTHDPIIVP